MSKINDKMADLKAKVSEFENYIKKFRTTKYDYHCANGIEHLHNELSQLKDWLNIYY